MRAQKSAKNIIVALISNALNIVLGVVVQSIFLKTLGEEYLGLNTVLTSILSMLSIAELGLGSAIIYNMYKPIANKDKEKITEILEEISDKKALKIANRDKTKQLTLTDEEILTILKFQIKYMISTHQIERIFGISKSNYKKRVKRLQTEHEKLVSDFEYIADFVSCIPNKVTERR